MPRTASIMSLHLRYRLWIAEMNFDINVLRIFDDYLKELESKTDKPEVDTSVNHFQQQFIAMRQEIDELRHEMHLIKMQLAAYSREKKPLETTAEEQAKHAGLESRYKAFRKTFNQLKESFRDFEARWLD